MAANAIATPIKVLQMAIVLVLRDDQKGGNEEVLIYGQTLLLP